jgi:hypothetical protein
LDSSKGRLIAIVVLLGVIAVAIYEIIGEGGLAALTGAGEQSIADLLFAAIAAAEGAPASWNNPLDITDTGYPGDIGVANAAGVRKFDTLQDGTNAGMTKLNNILAGNSSTYPLSLSITQFGGIWSGGDSNWAINVASFLGVDPSVTLGELTGATT